jgi:predicted ester cyclase
MSNEDKNIALVRAVVQDVQQDGKFDLIDKFIHQDWINHTVSEGQSPKREGVHYIMRYLHSALSEIKMDIESCVCTGDMVATNKVMSGKHVGDLFGNTASNQRVQFRIMDFMRVHEGQLIEHWACIGPVEPAK